MTNPTTPSVPATIRETLRGADGGVREDELVRMVAADADASERLVRLSLGRLADDGEIYPVGNAWKVTEA